MAYSTQATKQLTAQLRLKGGVAVRTLTGTVTCDAATETFCSWDPGGASRDVTLPAEETSDGLFFVFVNEADAAENLVIKNDGGSTVTTIGQGEWAIVACTGTAWFDAPFSALSDYLATANTWSAIQTFTGVRMASAGATAITTTRAMTLADSGGIFSVAQSSAYDIDLPSPTSGAGCSYTFYLTSPGAFNVTITVAGAAATFVGVIVNDVTSVIPATGSTLTFASGASALGDTIVIKSISTGLYHVQAVTSAAGGITIA